MSQHRTMAPAEGRIAALQSLRAIAALLVLFQHATQVAPPGASAAGIALRGLLGPFGSAGVDLFFVISGFVIAHGIAGAKAPPPHRFLIGRAIRILPLFWLMTALYAVQLLAAGTAIAPDIWINSLTLLPLTGDRETLFPLLYVGWSLGFELVFYAVAGMMLAAPRRSRVPMLLTALLGLAAAGIARGPADGMPMIPTNPILIEFALGVAAWLLWRRGVERRIATMLAMAGVALLVSGLFVDIGQGFETDPRQIILGVTSLRRAIVWGLPAALMLLGIVARAPGAADAPLARIGDASFSLYLVHPIVLLQIARLRLLDTAPEALALPILMIVPILVALAVHRWIERPIMRRGKALAQAAPRNAAPPGPRLAVSPAGG